MARLAVLVTAVLFLAPASGLARTAGGPFYLVPSPEKECLNISNCVPVLGPWVVVPARQEATYLATCKSLRNFVVDGTDARASSTSIRVWFDGRIGGGIGVPPQSILARAILLFHAVSNNGEPGSFQPLLGCVTQRPASKRATFSARRVAGVPGTPASPPLDLRANNRVLEFSSGRMFTACAPGEKLVGRWSALSVNTTGPPARVYANSVSVDRVPAGNRVRATYQVASVLLAPLAPVATLQVGAMCEP